MKNITKTGIAALSLILLAGALSPTDAAYPYRNCKQYIKSAKWIKRFGEMSLSVVPTDCGRSIHPRETKRAFNELYRKHVHDKNWYNTQSMRNQFSCHLAIARHKPEWNLEPYRKDVGYKATQAANCNPH